jgi:hypothetical protein
VAQLLPTPLEREWLAAALETLIAARGEDTFLTAPLLLPEDRFFPDRFTPDAAGVTAPWLTGRRRSRA